MNYKTRIQPGSGPHAGKLEVKYKNKWHFVKWLSKRDMLKRHADLKLEKQK